MEEALPDAKYQCYIVHFYRNTFSIVPRPKVKLVAKMLKSILAQEDKKAVRKKARAAVSQLKEMELKKAAKKVENNMKQNKYWASAPPKMKSSINRFWNYASTSRNRRNSRKRVLSVFWTFVQTSALFVKYCSNLK